MALAIGALVGGVVKEALGPLLNLIPDPNARKEAAEEFQDKMLNGLTSLVQGQLAINQQEAAHPSIWVAGWRPAVGWTCAVGVAWAFVLKPLLSFVVVTFALLPDGTTLPDTNTGELMTLLMGMLGLGGLRTYEKQIGVARTFWGKKKKDGE